MCTNIIAIESIKVLFGFLAVSRKARLKRTRRPHTGAGGRWVWEASRRAVRRGAVRVGHETCRGGSWSRCRRRGSDCMARDDSSQDRSRRRRLGG